MATVLATPTAAQYTGVWTDLFDHRVSTAAQPVANATDPGLPFSATGLDGMTFYVSPTLGQAGWPDPGTPALQSLTGRMFNALHMSVIPKGDNQGKVLVWDSSIIVAKVPPVFGTLGALEWWSFQAYAIVDPDPNAATRFQNFLLPIEKVVSTADINDPAMTPNLFCAGHAWSPYGDLIVYGGTLYQNFQLLGPRLTYVFNPTELTARFPAPGVAAPLYGATAKGHWIKGPNMFFGRWYPTATLTGKLNRILQTYPMEGEVMLALGGTRQFNNPSPAFNHTWNSYEAMIIAGPSGINTHNLVVDDIGTPTAPDRVWQGPGTNPDEHVDWLLEYPRVHLLSTGRLFYSGYAPRGALLDHEVPGTWTQTVPQPSGYGNGYSSNWDDIRHDGSSVLMPAANGIHDIVMRVGGADELPTPTGAATTATAEVSVGGGHWTPSSSLPTTDNANDGERVYSNVAILPTGALCLTGGFNIDSPQFVGMNTPLIFADGRWQADTQNPAASARDYHSTAVLLPDGRVMVAGGEQRGADYEIYSPYYTQLPPITKPTNVGFFGTIPPFHPINLAYELEHGESYQVSCALLQGSLTRAVLIAPGSTTHHSDMHQRFVELDTNVTAFNQATVVIPDNNNLLPRGYYMLWLLTSRGAVSDATWVRIK